MTFSVFSTLDLYIIAIIHVQEYMLGYRPGSQRNDTPPVQIQDSKWNSIRRSELLSDLIRPTGTEVTGSLT
jgi:hypothetical protein